MKTKTDVAELRRLEQAATKGPWLDSGTTNSSYHDIVGNPRDAVAAHVPTASPGEVATTRICRVFKQIEGEANFKLLIAARNSLPTILDELEQARTESERLREVLEPFAKCGEPVQGDPYWNRLIPSRIQLHIREEHYIAAHRVLHEGRSQ